VLYSQIPLLLQKRRRRSVKARKLGWYSHKAVAFFSHVRQPFPSEFTHVTVATSPVVLCWLYDSPRTGCARRTKYIYVARTSNNRV